MALITTKRRFFLRKMQIFINLPLPSANNKLHRPKNSTRDPNFASLERMNSISRFNPPSCQGTFDAEINY